MVNHYCIYVCVHMCVLYSWWCQVLPNTVGGWRVVHQ